MLRVIYQATELKPGLLADWHEERGLVKILVASGTRADRIIPQLNAALRDLIKNAHWYQVWDGEIVSADHPENPIGVTFEASPFDPAPLVDIREHKGHVALYVPPAALIDDIVKVLNPAIEEFLAGGCWFQLWHGEIITIDSAEAMAA
jgi:hypothetical protein